MAGKVKEINNNEVFLQRFRALVYGEAKSQDELAKVFGASRQTMSKWMLGQSIPDIDALKKMAEHYGVSADYLLGLSDTASVDVNVKAAVEYTGLSEAAVEWLHIGLDDFACDGVGLSDENKKENLDTASALIQDKTFTKIIYNLKEISMSAYCEEILKILNEEYFKSDMSSEDREAVVANLIYFYEQIRPWEKDLMQDRLNAMEDIELEGQAGIYWYDSKEQNERHQFHAAKAFNGYIDQVVEASRKKARERFEK